MKSKTTNSGRGRPKENPRLSVVREEAGKPKPGGKDVGADENKIESPTKPPPTPYVLRGDKVAVAKWKETAIKMMKAGTLGDTDLDTLEAYCYTYAQWRKAVKERKKAFTEKTKNGNLIQHPIFSIEKSLSEDLLKLRKELGLTPKSRRSVSRTTTPGQDDLLD